MKVGQFFKIEIALKKKAKLRAIKNDMKLEEYIEYCVEKEIKSGEPITLTCSKEGIKIAKEKK